MEQCGCGTNQLRIEISGHFKVRGDVQFLLRNCIDVDGTHSGPPSLHHQKSKDQHQHEVEEEADEDARILTHRFGRPTMPPSHGRFMVSLELVRLQGSQHRLVRQRPC